MRVGTLLDGKTTSALDLAMRALRGVGDETLGQWVEMGDVAVHVRRRLSLDEAAYYGLRVRDIRGTPEVNVRLAKVRHLLPIGYSE